MSRLLSLLYCLVLCGLLSPTSAQDCATIVETTGGDVNSSGFARIHGKPKITSVQLLDADDKPLQLIGVSSHNIIEFANCYTFEALEYLVEEWGITVFRITVYLEGGNSYYSAQASNDAAIANLVDWCEVLGIYVIIDYHVMENGDPNHYLDYQGAPTGRAITFWQKQANAYKDKDHVIYEIANEPNNADWIPNIVAYLNAVIGAIRAIDAESVIIAGTPHWSQYLFYPGNDGGVTNTHNVMYSFHFYAASHLFLYEIVEQYSRSLPVFVSEWSPSSFTTTEEPNLVNSDKFTELFSGSLPNNPISISSTAWDWSDKANEEVSILTSGSCASKNWGSLTCSGKYLKNYIHDYRLAMTASPSTSPTADGETLPPTVSPSLAPTVYTDTCVADASLLVKVHKR